jgi:hypothetical protein
MQPVRRSLSFELRQHGLALLARSATVEPFSSNLQQRASSSSASAAEEKHPLDHSNVSSNEAIEAGTTRIFSVLCPLYAFCVVAAWCAAICMLSLRPVCSVACLACLQNTFHC